MGQFERLTQPDLLIACVPRSGSTMLALRLDYPADQVFLREPFLDKEDRCEQCCQEIIDARIWGLKEISVAHILPILEYLKPKNILCLIRNLEHVAISVHEWIVDYTHPGGLSLDSARNLILGSAAFIQELSEKYIVWKYEEMVRNFEPCEAYLDNLGFKLGRVRTKEDTDDLTFREHELIRHGPVVSDKSVLLRDAETREDRLYYAWSILQDPRAKSFQRHFGYGSYLI